MQYIQYKQQNCRKGILMFCISEQSHYQFMLRSARNITRQRRKFSAGYKKRNYNDRSKEKEASLFNYCSEQMQNRRNDNTSNLACTTKRRNLIGLIEQKNSNLTSNKKVSYLDACKGKDQDFSIIMQNIKDVFKANQKISKKESQEAKHKVLSSKEDFLCLRTKLHQQLYLAQMKEDYFLPNEQVLHQIKRYSRQQANKSSKKKAFNPFLNTNTVTCSSVVLNQHCSLKKPPLQISNSTPTTTYKSFYTRRSTQVTQPTQASQSSHKKSMTFHICTSEGDQIYLKKIKNYLQFLLKVNFSNNIYVNLDIKYEEHTFACRYKVFIGKGNNSQLVKSLLKRRFWWEVTNNIEENQISLYWTQGKLDKILSNQKVVKPKKVTMNVVTKKVAKIGEESIILNKKILSQQKSTLVQQYINSQGFTIPFEQTYKPDIVTNHLPRNNSIGSKKNLFKSLFYYYQNIANKNPFHFIPETYHINSKDCEQFKQFLSKNESQPNKIWIVKPGENTNRGKSIQLSSFSKIEQCLNRQKHQNGETLTYIIQSYINKPFLYNNRKFDIRHYMLITSVNGILKAYWYRQGYIRTSSEAFDLQNLTNKFIHLTNDAIQKHSQNYEKYQPANKLSYTEFQRYLDYTYPNKNYNLERDILTKMKEMACDIVKANYLVIDNKRLNSNFQIFGLDFMIDRQWRPWLIEVNYNPCLEVNCPVLERVIPAMLQNSFRLALDPIFPPPCHFPSSKRFYLSDNYLKNLKYELIFDEQGLKTPIKNSYIFEEDQEQDEQFQDEGQQFCDIHI